jgi:D-alanine-D-alanine ligase
MVLHESEAACGARLQAGGVPTDVAAEVAFYLAQGTDFAAMLPEIAGALAAAGIELTWISLDERDRWLAPARPGTLAWCLTDGFRWYRGSLASSALSLLGMPLFGSPPAIQHMAQDKFRCLAAAQALGLSVPPTALVEDGEPLSSLRVLPANGPYFVKPNTLGAKLGLTRESRCATLREALALTQAIWSRYGDRALIQPYLDGEDIRVSYLDLGRPERPLGIQRVTTSGAGGFPTLADSRRMTRLSAPGESAGLAVTVESLEGSVRMAIELAARRLERALPLRDYWSTDFRLVDGVPWFLELETAPAVTIYDFRTYLRTSYGLDLPEALAEAAPAAYARRLAANQEARRRNGAHDGR